MRKTWKIEATVLTHSETDPPRGAYHHVMLVEDALKEIEESYRDGEKHGAEKQFLYSQSERVDDPRGKVMRSVKEVRAFWRFLRICSRILKMEVPLDGLYLEQQAERFAEAYKKWMT